MIQIAKVLLQAIQTLIVQAKNPRNPLQTAKPYSLRRLVAGNVSDMLDLAAVCLNTAWDSRNLYLRISVADERLINDSSVPWEDDALSCLLTRTVQV